MNSTQIIMASIVAYFAALIIIGGLFVNIFNCYRERSQLRTKVHNLEKMVDRQEADLRLCITNLLEQEGDLKRARVASHWVNGCQEDSTAEEIEKLRSELRAKELMIHTLEKQLERKKTTKKH